MIENKTKQKEKPKQERLCFFREYELRGETLKFKSLVQLVFNHYIQSGIESTAVQC